MLWSCENNFSICVIDNRKLLIVEVYRETTIRYNDIKESKK